MRALTFYDSDYKSRNGSFTQKLEFPKYRNQSLLFTYLRILSSNSIPNRYTQSIYLTMTMFRRYFCYNKVGPLPL